MSAKTTPAIERADAAVREAWSGRDHATELRGIVYAPPVRPGGATDALIRLAIPTALAAALDRQEIARSLYEHHAADIEWRDQVTLCDWADVEQTTGEAYLEQADGVIATVLGTGDEAADPWAAAEVPTETTDTKPFTDHAFRPGHFDQTRCQVMLARYRCPYSAEAHPTTEETPDAH